MLQTMILLANAAWKSTSAKLLNKDHGLDYSDDDLDGATPFVVSHENEDGSSWTAVRWETISSDGATTIHFDIIRTPVDSADTFESYQFTGGFVA